MNRRNVETYSIGSQQESVYGITGAGRKSSNVGRRDWERHLSNIPKVEKSLRRVKIVIFVLGFIMVAGFSATFVVVLLGTGRNETEIKEQQRNISKIEEDLKMLRKSLIALQDIIFQRPTRSCLEIHKSGGGSGVYFIHPFSDHSSAEVFCDQTTDGGGWTVIQRRVDATTSFRGNWSTYKQRFGSPYGNYWIGLETLHKMTNASDYELRIDLMSFHGVQKYAKYRKFKIGSEETDYTLTIALHTGDTDDSMGYHNGLPFSTADRDNSNMNYNCASVHAGSGWWFGSNPSCFASNLNGAYLNAKDARSVNWTGIIWNGLLEGRSLKRAQMMVRIEANELVAL